MEMKRIALYARVSSSQHTHQRTIETQSAALREYALNHE
jgi:DNA invertase Pin-like site-specific DNA recombinase